MKQKNLKKVIINKYIKMKLQGKLVKKLQVESGTTNNGTEWKNQTLKGEKYILTSWMLLRSV